MSQEQVSVTGLHCQHCAAAVRAPLQNKPGITRIDVQLPAGSAVVTFDSEQTSRQRIASLVEEAGYEVE